ncbi:MAG TPA: rod shape-determining protein MreC [Allosphingosinicella sp.]|nr:rod shape-determining protein MreC [Allosphingosinicella sp.]
MAPPSSRRAGFSRRAQYGLFLGYVVAVAGILFALLLLAIAAIDPRGFAALKGAALDATAPIGRGAGEVGRFFGGIVSGIGDYVRAGSKNAELRREVESARRELIRAKAIEFENRRLRQIVGLAGEIEDEVTQGRIVGSSYTSGRRFATLAAGTASGVAIGQPVRAPEGLIGRVLETGRWAARILLLSDAYSNVPVRLTRDGTSAFAKGTGEPLIELRTLEVGPNPFRIGDIVVTSGVGGLYPPNIPVARVVRIEGDKALAAPVAEPGRADFAIVLRPYQPAADGPLEAGPRFQEGPVTVAAPPPAPGQANPATSPTRQRSPQYQPALQRPQAAVPGAARPPEPRR